MDWRHQDQFVLKDKQMLKGDAFKWAEGQKGRRAEGRKAVSSLQ